MKILILPLMMSFSLSAFAEKWDGNNNPLKFTRIIGSNMLMNFDELPLTGRVSDKRLGWSETYWPSILGGIGYRWNHPDPQPFKYRLHTKQEIMSMSKAQLSQLSPAELYDISQGDYSYRLTRWTRSNYNTRMTWWSGICHGWALAAAHYPEPRPVVVINPDGVRVPFGSSDVKGLLSMHDGYNSHGAYAQIGKRCYVKGKVEGEEDARDGGIIRPSPEDANSPDCKDVNAGSFHLVITNMIGVYSKSFVAEIDRYNDIWNQPVMAYESQVLAEEEVTPEHRMQGIERRIRIRNKMTYGEELQLNLPENQKPESRFTSKLPVTGTDNQRFKSKDYEYILELDASGRIVGGQWISQTRPDFIWMKTRNSKFVSSKVPLSGLNAIYRPVRH